MGKAFKHITEIIKSREYLLGFQKEQLLEDLESVPMDEEQLINTIDSIFYRLFNRGWDDLTTMEQNEIKQTWRGASVEE